MGSHCRDPRESAARNDAAPKTGDNVVTFGDWLEMEGMPKSAMLERQQPRFGESRFRFRVA